MNVAFCINRLGLVGLGVTISSLISNCSNTEKLTLWFLCADITDKDKNHLRQLLASEEFCGDFHLIDFNPFFIFGSFPSLHGDWTPYGRLLLVDYISEDQVLYLDSDLVVELDVLELEHFNFKDYVLAAVGGGKFKYALGSKFYVNTLGFNPEWEYFNSGVLLLNLCKWREKQVKEICIEIANQSSAYLPSHDQSLLNIYCAGKFAKLPSSFNCEWFPDKPKPEISERMILHFVGSPKPWDPFGFIIHKGYQTWQKYLNKEWASAFIRVTPAYLGRAWKIRRSYIRCMRNKIVN